MAWYDTTNKGSMQDVSYDPSAVRGRNAQSEGKELENTDNAYKIQQKQNQDAAFSNSVEQKKIVDKDGKVTYSLYLDPDKYAEALFKQSKKTGTKFNMDDAMAQAKYQTARMQGATAQNLEAQTQRAQGMKVEGEPKPYTSETSTPTIKAGTLGEVRIGKDGTSYTFDGQGWHKTDESKGGF